MACSEAGFREHLQAALDRTSEIENLGRTREIVVKDLVRGGRYSVVNAGGGWGGRGGLQVELRKEEEKEP